MSDSGHAERHPALLHNMSMRPNTTVCWHTGGLGSALVRFKLKAHRRKPVVRRSANPAFALALDTEWQRIALRGAALIYEALPVPEAAVETSRAALHVPERLSAVYEPLILNVLGRACGGLLLASTPIQLEGEWLARELWCDDPRVVAVARSSGVEVLP